MQLVLVDYADLSVLKSGSLWEHRLARNGILCIVIFVVFGGTRTPWASQTPPEPVFVREEPPQGGETENRVHMQHVQMEGRPRVLLYSSDLLLLDFHESEETEGIVASRWNASVSPALRYPILCCLRLKFWFVAFMFLDSVM